MNKNEECNIVKDLSSLHIDNMLSESSKKFVESHLKECENCNKYYEALNSTFLNNEKKEKTNDNIEINHLKKVNKKITTIKWILTGIIVFILLTIGYFFCKIVYIDSINDMNINKLLDMQRNSNNYKLICETTEVNKEENKINKSKTVYYYKDGKNKELVFWEFDGKMQEDRIMYIADEGYEKVTVSNSSKQIDYQMQDFIQKRKGDTLNIIISRIMLNDAGIHKLGLKVRTEVFNDRECFVVSDSYDGYYRENYIDKETGDLLRTLSGSPNYYTEEVFYLTENVVTDEDVEVPVLENEEKYKDYKVNNVTYKANDIIKEIYKNK